MHTIMKALTIRLLHVGLLTDVKVLSEVARRDVPVVAKHIDTLQVPWALFSSKWFICLFSEVCGMMFIIFRNQPWFIGSFSF